MTTDENINKFLFIGKGWSFPPKFNKALKEVELRDGNDDIVESLQVILTTLPGERIYHPEFGCDLTPLLFETLSNSVEKLLSNRIKDAVTKYERRIVFDDAVFELLPAEGVVYISIKYTVKSDNSRYNMVFPFYLKEGNEA
jgi:hypothetical protein